MSDVLELIEAENAETEFSSPRMTFEEYLRFGGEDTWAEWIDGEVIVMYSASTRHQEIVGFLNRVIGIYIENHQLGRIFIAPYAMKLEKQRRGREPDLLFVSRENLHLIEQTFLNGAADLVVEVISPESIGRDRGDKFVEYESAGVKEYWLIDYEREQAEFYILQPNGRYQLSRTENGIFHSQIIEGLFVREEWFWQEQPATISALQELKIL